MRKYKYTKETLDVILEELQSKNVVQRKKCINFISMVSRSELFGKACDMLSVQTWFSSSENREKLIRVLHQETEEKLLWEYLLILSMVCERYIDHGCYAKDFTKKSSRAEFKQRAYEITKQYVHHSSTIVCRMLGSIVGYMEDNDVWGIFCNVMLKKRNLPTISRTTMGIKRHCTGVASGNNHFFGGTVTDNQRMDILNSSRLIYQKSSNKSIKGMCLRTIEELESIKEAVNKAR